MEKIDGKIIAFGVKDKVKEEISMNNYKVILVIIQVGEDSASSIYVRNKEKACEYCGIKVITQKLPEDITEKELLSYIDMWNKAPEVNGILVQLPLPKHIDEQKIFNAIEPIKDVDGFHPVNVTKLWMNNPSAIIPCTAKGVIKLIESTGEYISGKNAVVIGRSNIVGKLIAKLLLDKGMSVTICHSKTPYDELAKYCHNTDVVVCAVGKPLFLKDGPQYKYDDVASPGIVIDVGINRTEDGKFVGDCDIDEMTKGPWSESCIRYYTPVPGGVGPMTIACLMENTLECYKVQNKVGI